MFEERGLLTRTRDGERLTLRLTSDGKKVELDKSRPLRRLREAL